MNTPDHSRMNGILTAIGIIVLLLGTATGNAYVMLAMAVAAMAVIGFVWRKAIGWSALLCMVAAAATAVAVAIGMARF